MSFVYVFCIFEKALLCCWVLPLSNNFPRQGLIPKPSGQFTKRFWKHWLDSHWEQTCPPPRFSFNFWPQVKMAAYHAGRDGSRFDQFSGSWETSASSLHPPFLSRAICLGCVDGVTGMASCASPCCGLIASFKRSHVSLSFPWLRGDKNTKLLAFFLWLLSAWEPDKIDFFHLFLSWLRSHLLQHCCNGALFNFPPTSLLSLWVYI